MQTILGAGGTTGIELGKTINQLHKRHSARKQKSEKGKRIRSAD